MTREQRLQRERLDRYAEKQRERGFVRARHWVHREDREALAAFVEELRARRLAR